MPRVKALRGVCIGVERHLTLDEIVDLPDDSMTQYLVSIGAVEVVPAAPVKATPETKAPEKSGKKE